MTTPLNQVVRTPYCMPGYSIDFAAGAVVYDPNYFSDLLARHAELAKSGESPLTQQEIEQLSETYNISQMSSQEYKDFVSYLADKGVIDRPKPLDFDPGERIAIKPGGSGWLEKAGLSNGIADGIPHYLVPELPQLYEKLLAQLAIAETLRATGGIGAETAPSRSVNFVHA